MILHTSKRNTPYGDDDPSKWPTAGAEFVAVGVDLGFAQDYPAIVTAGRWPHQGQAFVGVMDVERLELNMDTASIIARVGALVNERASYHSQPQVIVDGRSNPTAVELFARAGFEHPPIAISARGGDQHSMTPTIRTIKPIDGQGKSVHVRQYSLSRNALIDLINTLIRQRQIRITNIGEGQAHLRDEMAGLEEVVTEARNLIYKTPAGGHDDITMALGAAAWGCLSLTPPRNRRGPVRKKPKPSVLAWG